MRLLNLSEVLRLHRRIVHQSGGTLGILNLGLLESALRQPRLVFGGEEMYPSLAEKAAVLGFAIIHHHPFYDGNKRTGHAAMELFLILNGYELIAPLDESEKVVLQVAAGELTKDELTSWIEHHLSPIRSI
ncbi:MAG: type II toxin-antitoxin system death-on-curing family toxin [Deltaproteobacteria bacterium]|nr:type II toxin-antitoxin system death-on-curing family toxin [Deltaproteobacteria bacterium]